MSRVSERFALIVAAMALSACACLLVATPEPKRTTHHEPVTESEVPHRVSENRWQNDYHLFVENLSDWTNRGRIPSRDELSKKFDKKECTVITDGVGGLIDLSPAQDTVQYKLNEHFAGQNVMWRITLCGDSIRGWPISNDLMLVPNPPGMTDYLDQFENTENASTSRFPTVLWISIRPKSPQQFDSLKRGDTIVLKGHIGDARRTTMLSFSGVNAAYHLGDHSDTAFIVGLRDAQITRVPPSSSTEANLKSNVCPVIR